MSSTYEVKHQEVLYDSIVHCPQCDEPIFFRRTVEARNVRRLVAGEEFTNTETGFGSELSLAERSFVSQIINQRKVFALGTQVRREFQAKRPEERDQQIHSRSAAIDCPYCAGQFQILFSVAVIGVVEYSIGKALAPDSGATDPLAHFPEQDRILYQTLTENGFFDSFFEAAAYGNPANGMPRTPKSKLSIVKAWFRLAATIEVPRKVLGRIIVQFGTAEPLFYHANGVVAVVVDEQIKLVMPLAIAKGQNVAGKLRAEGSVSERPRLEYWVKTKWGYTVGRGLHYEALRLECAGSYGNATKEQRK